MKGMHERLPDIRIGSWLIDNLMWNPQNTSKIENIIVSKRLEIFCLHGNLGGTLKLVKLNTSCVTLKANSQ